MPQARLSAKSMQGGHSLPHLSFTMASQTDFQKGDDCQLATPIQIVGRYVPIQLEVKANDCCLLADALGPYDASLMLSPSIRFSSPALLSSMHINIENISVD